MQGNVALELAYSVKATGFSLDELVVKLKAVMEAEGLPGIVELVLALVQEQLLVDLVEHRDRRPAYLPKCCGHPHWRLAGVRQSQRGLRTTIGTVRPRWRGVRCTRCGRYRVPLRHFLHWRPHQSPSNELVRTVVETVSEQTYGRAAGHLETIGLVPVPKSTAHRWVAESGADRIRINRDTFVEHLFADGTGFKRRPDPAAKVTNKGELRLVLGVTPDGRLRPFGVWAQENWQQIAADFRRRTDNAQVAEFLHVDGEAAIVEALGPFAAELQRCHWHLVHGLGYALWEDGVAWKRRRHLSKRLAGIIQLEVEPTDIEAMPAKEHRQWQERLVTAQRDLRTLTADLWTAGHAGAANYLDKAFHHVFRYVDYWLKYGLACPRTINLVERLMRELGRRLKKMAFGWSEAGAARIARIIIRRLTTPQTWERYWRRRLRLDGAVNFICRGVAPA